MTNKHTKSGDDIILKEGDNTIVDNNEVCEIFNDYFANIASSIGLKMLSLVLRTLSINTIAIPVS